MASLRTAKMITATLTWFTSRRTISSLRRRNRAFPAMSQFDFLVFQAAILRTYSTSATITFFASLCSTYVHCSSDREDDGRLSSTDPDLFADDGLERLCDCVGGEAAVWLRNKRGSLELAQQASGDPALKKDRMGPGQLTVICS
jgi:hypothetical protein